MCSAVCNQLGNVFIDVNLSSSQNFKWLKLPYTLMFSPSPCVFIQYPCRWPCCKELIHNGFFTPLLLYWNMAFQWSWNRNYSLSLLICKHLRKFAVSNMLSMGFWCFMKLLLVFRVKFLSEFKNYNKEKKKNVNINSAIANFRLSIENFTNY